MLIKSSLLHATNGVPQGFVLRRILLNILINDISQVADKAKIILYADDTPYIMHIKSDDDSRET